MTWSNSCEHCFSFPRSIVSDLLFFLWYRQNTTVTLVCHYTCGITFTSHSANKPSVKIFWLITRLLLICCDRYENIVPWYPSRTACVWWFFHKPRVRPYIHVHDILLTKVSPFQNKSYIFISVSFCLNTYPGFHQVCNLLWFFWWQWMGLHEDNYSWLFWNL